MRIQDLLNLKKIALQNRIEDDVEYFIEKCYRYFSKTYHTPLMMAKKQITVAEAVVTYFEDMFEEITLEEAQDQLKEMIKSLQPVIGGSMSEESAGMSDDEWITQQELLLKKKEESEKKKDFDKIQQETAKALESLRSELSNFKTVISKVDESEGNE